MSVLLLVVLVTTGCDSDVAPQAKAGRASAPSTPADAGTDIDVQRPAPSLLPMHTPPMLGVMDVLLEKWDVGDLTSGEFDVLMSGLVSDRAPRTRPGGFGPPHGMMGPAGCGADAGRHGALAHAPPALSPEQQSELDALRDEFDAGDITHDEFAASMREIVGASPHGMGHGQFGPPHGPPGFGHHRPMMDAIDLTTDQQEQADAIFEQFHQDVRTLREDAHGQMRNVLTEQQQAALLGDGTDCPHGRGHFQGHGFHGPPSDRPALSIDLLTGDLALTQQQQAEMDSIRELLHEAIEARHDTAREAFEALLTPEQLAAIEEIKAQHDQAPDASATDDTPEANGAAHD